MAMTRDTLDYETPEWRIVRADPADAAALSLIARATFLQAFASLIDGSAIIEHCRFELSEARLSRDLEQASSAAWLAQHADTGSPLGFAQLGATRLPEASAADLELKRIYILPEFRGTGLAQALWREVMNAAFRRGAERIVLAVYRHNRPARAFYDKLGFHGLGNRGFEVGGKHYEGTVLAFDLASRTPDHSAQGVLQRI